MATKVTILGMDEPKEKELKPIEFAETMNEFGNWVKARNEPSFYKNIKLMSRGQIKGYDFFAAWNNDSYVLFYLGHFNDGIV